MRSALLSLQGFRLLFLARFVSTVGGTMAPVALTLALLRSGRSSSLVGDVLAAGTVPLLLFMAAGGVASDRYSKRAVLVMADILRVFSQILLAGTLLFGTMHVTAIMVLVATTASFGAFAEPAFSGMLVQLVPKDLLQKANGALTVADSLASILGPAAAGLVFVTKGPGWVIAIDAISFAISAAFIAFIRTPPKELIRSDSIRYQFSEGYREFTKSSWLWLTIIQLSILNLLAFAPFMVIGPYILSTIPECRNLWGIVLSAAGVGGVVGGLCAFRWVPRRPLVAVELATFSVIIPLTLFAAHAGIGMILLAGFMIGVSGAIVNILVISTLQREIRKELISRVFSVVRISSLALTPLGYVIAGPAELIFGPEEALWLSIIAVSSSVLVLLMIPTVRNFRTTDTCPAGASS